MDYKNKEKNRDNTSLNQKKPLFYKAAMDTKLKDDQQQSDVHEKQIKIMNEMEQEKQLRDSELEKPNPIQEKQAEVNAGELSTAEMDKEEQKHIRDLSKEKDGSLKYGAGTDVDKQLKTLAALSILSLVSLPTLFLLFRTFETVVGETPHLFAMSLIPTILSLLIQNS